ncbi:MAG: hypothetical protein Q7S56_03015 [Nanoarchaeota archaeon]|nr:hypothetical protein [Nanoarchaeota archaeon]
MTSELPFYELYPTFEIQREGGILPRIYLPKDFIKILPSFYNQGRKKTVDDYAQNLGRVFEFTPLKSEIELCWGNKTGVEYGDETGLIHISVGLRERLDLGFSCGGACFIESNLGTHNSFITGAIAMKYVSELLKTII